MEESAPMVNWEVEMHETARKLSAQLDSKMGALEQLTREADRAAARLEAALTAGRHRMEPSIAATAPADASPPAPNRPAEAPPASQAEGLRSAGPIDSPTASRPPAERRYEEIYTLADYGLGPSEIAHRVGSPVGEVELILSLRGKR
jgi:hypothetical protein